MGAATKAVTDTNFEADVLKSQKPVLVDFWAEWCGPCKMVGPILEELAGEMGNDVTIAKMNVDENPMTPSKYGIRGIPTMMLFKGGELKATKVGALPKQALQAWIKEQI
ncbi:MAG TPA: thioredoxin [Alphaproteobacteria bacterium]|nr:thioredoxin [Alphaproteobacteria bacterium]